MSPALIRPGRSEDAEALADLFNAINSMDGPPPPVPMTATAVRRDLLGPDPWAVLLVAEVEGDLRGFVTGNPVYDSARAAGAFFLNDLYVVPEARRQGIGRALVAHLAAMARRRGAGCLWWGVDLGDDWAFAFYRALGAEDEGPFRGHLLIGPAFDSLASQAVS